MAGGQTTVAAHSCRAASHKGDETHTHTAGSRTAPDTQSRSAAGSVPPPEVFSIANVQPEGEHFAALRVLADTFFDVQEARKAIVNRTSAKKLKHGTVIPPVVAPEVLADALDSFKKSEKQIGSAMRAAFRQAAPEIYAWVKDTPGLGEHLVARLVGAIGHPVTAQPYHWEGEGADRVLIADEPFARNVAKLWALCGHGDPNRRKRKGMSAEDAMALGNPKAKMLTHLIAEGCMKCVGSRSISEAQGASAADTDSDGGATWVAKTSSTPPRRRSPYRDVYDRGRLIYAQREEWTDAHRHNAALRLVGKEFLRDLWLVAQGREPLIRRTYEALASLDGGSESEEGTA